MEITSMVQMLPSSVHFLDNIQNERILLGIGVFQLFKKVLNSFLEQKSAWLRLWLFHIWNKGSSTKETHQFKPVILARILEAHQFKPVKLA